MMMGSGPDNWCKVLILRSSIPPDWGTGYKKVAKLDLLDLMKFARGMMPKTN
jgi:hypothetical protein